jgi:hypothetical protein
VDDELLTRATTLVGVVLAGEDERRSDGVTVDRDQRLLGVLLDDREEVRQKLALAGGEQRELGLCRARRDLLQAACAVVNPRYVRPSSRVCS